MLPMLALLVRLALLILLLALLHHVQHTEHNLHRVSRTKNATRTQPAHTALVTLADPMYAPCALNLLQAARANGWRESMFLLGVDVDGFTNETKEGLDELGVTTIVTTGALDTFLERGVENLDVFRTLEKTKMRKMEMFLSPVLRSFERVVFMDADGIIDAPLDPLLYVKIPDNVTVLMRQNDRAMGKGRLWENELAIHMLTKRQVEILSRTFPNREMTGGSCWMIVDMQKLASPHQMVVDMVNILCTFRAAFRLNDQTLLALLFYRSMKLFPWCIWDELTILETSHDLHEWCQHNWKLQLQLLGQKKFMYRHLNPIERTQCTSPKPPPQPSQQPSTIPTHIISDDADCLTALEQWQRRLPPK